MTLRLGLTWLEWMHPSWRDMVIDFLVENKEEREHFLRKCGLQGLLLALSTGGGKQGLRKFPLLTDPVDWSICAESISQLIAAGDTGDLGSILKAVLDTLRVEFTPKHEPTLARPPLRDVAEVTLSACRRTWSLDGWAIQSTDLRSYYQISEFLSPLPPSPDLSQSWQRHWDAARSQMEKFDEYDSDVMMGDVDDWLDLCIVILDYEPRFARQVILPTEYEPHVKEFLPKLSDRAAWAPDFDSIDECDNELERQGVIFDLVTKISRVFEPLEESAAEIAAAAENTQELVLVRKGILEERVEDESREYLHEDEDEIESTISKTPPERTKTVFLTTPPTAHVSIEQLFEDL